MALFKNAGVDNEGWNHRSGQHRTGQQQVSFDKNIDKGNIIISELRFYVAIDKK